LRTGCRRRPNAPRWRVRDERDWSWLSGRREATAAPAVVQTLLWAVTKNGRRAELALRRHPLGLEIRSTVGRDIVWSQVVRDAREVGVISEEHLRAWLDRGWTLEQPRDPQ
jgi:hypothetical protein